MKRLAFAVAALFAVAFSVMPALAQAVSDTQVQIPIGDWIGHVAGFVASITAALIAWGLRQLPAQYVAIAKTARLDQLLERAITYACNATRDATRDKVLSVDVGNEVLKKALDFAVQHGSGSLIAWAGGEAALRAKIIARLDVAPEAALQ